MTDTLSREQIVMRLAQWDAADPIVKHSTQATHWEDCWRVHAACACELLGDALRTALAVMDERDALQSRTDADEANLRTWQETAHAIGASRDAAKARVAQLEGENRALRVAAEDMLSWCENDEIPSPTAVRSMRTALLSSPGRVPETFQGVTLAHQGASSGAEPRAIPSDAELQAPLKWDVIAGIKAGMPIDDVVLQRLCNMAQDRACQLEGSYPNHRTEQSRAREAATRAEGSSEKSRAPDVTEEDVVRADALYDKAFNEALSTLPAGFSGRNVDLYQMRAVLEDFATRLAGRGDVPTPATQRAGDPE